MHKKEYIYTHALLAEVTRYLIENDTMSAEMLSAYDAIETRPASIHKSKQDHREAVVILSSAIESNLTEEHTGNPEQSLNR